MDGFTKQIEELQQQGKTGLVTLHNHDNGKPGADILEYDLTHNKPVMYHPYVEGLFI